MKRFIGRIAIVGVVTAMQVAPADATAASLIERLTGSAPATSAMRAFVPLDGAPATVSYYEDAPCPPATRRPVAAHAHRHRRRPPMRIAKVAPRIAPRPAPKPHPLLVRLHHHVRPHHRAPLRIAAVPPARCEILHREALYRPGLAVDQDALTLVSEAVPNDIVSFSPEAPLVDTAPPAVRGLTLVIPSPPLFGGGFRPFRPFTSAAPEPETWALMLIGVGAAGLALRRRWAPVRA